MRSYWGIDHGEEVSKLGSPKVSERRASYVNLRTGGEVPGKKRDAGYEYRGKSLIMRRPKYRAGSAPGHLTPAGESLMGKGELGARMSQRRWDKKSAKALHSSYQSGKPSFTRNGETYRASR